MHSTSIKIVDNQRSKSLRDNIFELDETTVYSLSHNSQDKAIISSAKVRELPQTPTSLTHHRLSRTLTKN